MKIHWIFWPFFYSMLFYLFVQFIWGSTGLVAMKEKKIIVKKYEENIAELNNFNETLSLKQKALGGEKDKVIVQARELGYIGENEKMLFYPDSPETVVQQDIGRIINFKSYYKAAETFYKTFAFCLFIILFLFYFIFKRDKSRSLSFV